MNKKLYFVVVFTLMFSASVMAERIAVLPFTGLSDAQANLLAGVLGTELKKEGGYDIAPRTPAMDAAFREQSIQRSGLTDTSRISALGKGANASYVVSGHVQSFGKKKLIAVSVIDVETLQQISGDYYAFTKETQIINYMSSLAKKLLNGMKDKSEEVLPTLAIFPLSAENEAAEGQRDIIAQTISIELAKNRTHGVVVRTSSLSNVMKEMNIQRQGFTDSSTVAKMGKAINADYVLFGQITEYGTKTYMQISVIDVETTLLAFGADEGYNNKKPEEIIKIVPKIASDIGKQARGKTGNAFAEWWLKDGKFLAGIRPDEEEKEARSIEKASAKAEKQAKADAAKAEKQAKADAAKAKKQAKADAAKAEKQAKADAAKAEKQAKADAKEAAKKAKLEAKK